ncbi:MAG: hypothetical protein AVDCRST_MAG62-1497 [uncultured Sphingomonas sp.]|uniref:Uncharacterized protein n=1 Tax=uncultured Sphingomonas sp. TaxID=158754 RepID=A0A6J4TLB8_9SPHN|nr:MAG: hypothetical protein AVDCRST_MAG62-1497 [uncultured Sphingomonas sp.]
MNAARRQQRIRLKEILLESSVRESAADSEETTGTEFDERLVEWMLSESARTSISEILRMIDRFVLPNGTPIGVDSFTALGRRATKE